MDSTSDLHLGETHVLKADRDANQFRFLPTGLLGGLSRLVVACHDVGPITALPNNGSRLCALVGVSVESAFLAGPPHLITPGRVTHPA